MTREGRSEIRYGEDNLHVLIAPEQIPFLLYTMRVLNNPEFGLGGLGNVSVNFPKRDAAGKLIGDTVVVFTGDPQDTTDLDRFKQIFEASIDAERAVSLERGGQSILNDPYWHGRVKAYVRREFPQS